jgi:tRNA(Ile)-lysidine synthase
VLTGGLVVRNFQPGDRFQPLGSAGHKKIKELFIEKKVPLSARARVPLVLAGDHVVWIPGYARAELGRIGAATTAIVRLKATVIDGLSMADDRGQCGAGV